MNHADDSQLMRLKVPPHSSEAEQSLLGGLLLDNTALEKVSWLAPNAFYEDRHRRLWSCLVRLIEAAKPADMVTVCNELGDVELSRAGGRAYIAELAQNTPSALNIRRYADLVYEKYVQRQLVVVGTEIAERALIPGGVDVHAMLDDAEAQILRIAQSSERQAAGPVDLQPLLARAFERIDHLYHQENKDGVTGLPTGFDDLDDKTAGLQPGDLIIIAGRPSMGKTALALNILENVAVRNGVPSVIFSMEMSGHQLATRLLGSIARVDQHQMRRGKLQDEEWSRLSTGMGKLHGAPVHIDESGGLTVAEVRARARRLKRQVGKLGLVVIDYLQLMEARSKGEHRATEVSEISRGLKAMAKELDCPVIALSQLNREVDKRTDRKPVLSDLRESGAIEQDADLILFLYRDEVYHPDEVENKGLAELIIGKQRQGPIGTVRLTFLGAHTRFENYGGDGSGFFRPRARKGKAVFDAEGAG